MTTLLTSLRNNKEIRQPKIKTAKAKDLVAGLRDEIVPAFAAGFKSKAIYKQLKKEKRFLHHYSSFNRAIIALNLKPSKK